MTLAQENAAAMATVFMMTADVVVSVLQYGDLDDESRDQLRLVVRVSKKMAAASEEFATAASDTPGG